jgi:hypothetical protein
MDIDLLPLADHEWSVTVRESKTADATTHRMTVDPESDITLGVSDEALLVREAIATYLDHGVATELPHDLTLDWLEHTVPGFLDELTARLS